MVALTLVLSVALAADPLVSELEARGLTESAFTEALRAVSSLDGPARRAALFEAGAVLHRGGAWKIATKHWMQFAPDDDAAKLALAWAQLRLRQPELAIQTTKQIHNADGSYLRAWMLLTRHDVGGALNAWRLVPTPSRLSGAAQLAVTEVSSWHRLPHRSPAVAGVMSALVPGAGQAYVGRWGEALSSLLVNGAFIASATSFSLRKQWAGAAVMGLFGVGFYGGNVLSAVGGAKRFDRRVWEEKVNHLRPLVAPHLVVNAQGAQVETPPATAAAADR